jgi:hypothetical protein
MGGNGNEKLIPAHLYCINILKEFGFCSGENTGGGGKERSRPVLIQTVGKGIIFPHKIRPNYMHKF